MTDKELRKLNRSALLEMLVEQSRENDRLRAQVDELQRLLSDRQLKINQADLLQKHPCSLTRCLKLPSKRLNSIWKISGSLSGRQEQVCQQIKAIPHRKVGAILPEVI